MTRNLLLSLAAGLALAIAVPVMAQDAASPDDDAASRDKFRQLDQDQDGFIGFNEAPE